MSKEAYYFSHDANARFDPKILAMRSVYGIEGYGMYWVFIEMLREADNFKLPKKQYIFNAIAMQMQSKADAKIDANYAKDFLHFCINECDLFDEDDAFFWSNSLLNRMKKKDHVSEKRREAAKKRWAKVSDTNSGPDEDDANAMQKNANAMQSDAIKGKENKGKEKKVNKNIYAEFVSMTETEFNNLVEKYGKEQTQKMIDVLDNYKGANNKKYASDYRAILNWVVERVTGAKDKPGTVGAGKKGSKFDGVKIGDE